MATVGGLLMATAFPPFGWWWAAIAAVALLAASTFGTPARWAAAYGGVAGLTFFLVLLNWMRVVGADAWIVLAAVCALWWVGLLIAQSVLQRLRAWPVLVACLWVTVETLRGSLPLGGFPWGRLAYAQVTGPLLPAAAVVGAAGLTFLVALGGCLIVSVAERAREHRSITAPALITPVGIAVGIAAAVLLVPSVLSPSTVGRVLHVGAVQGGVTDTGLTGTAERRAVLAAHVRLTRELAAKTTEPLDVVIWPESSTDIDPYRDPQAHALIDAVVDAVGVPVLVGAVIDAPEDPSRAANAGIMWLPGTGPSERYVKQHPVPFGEYVPMRELLGERIDRLRLVPRDFIAGDAVGLFDVAGVTIGDIICFEVAYDSIVRDTVKDGAQLLVVQTNNATYGGTTQLAQQVAMSRLRAVEFGRPVVVAATTGISAMIDADGTVISSLGDGQSGVLVEPLRTRTGLTLATRIGVWLQAAMITVTVAGLVLALVRGRRKRTP